MESYGASVTSETFKSDRRSEERANSMKSRKRARDKSDESPRRVMRQRKGNSKSRRRSRSNSQPYRNMTVGSSSPSSKSRAESMERNECFSLCEMLRAVPAKPWDLIQRFIEINQPPLLSVDQCGQNLLFYAVKHSKKAVEYLVQRNVEVDRPNNRGKTPLVYALSVGSARTVQFLLASGADPNYADSSGNTPLDYVKRLKNRDRRITLYHVMRSSFPKLKSISSSRKSQEVESQEGLSIDRKPEMSDEVVERENNAQRRYFGCTFAEYESTIWQLRFLGEEIGKSGMPLPDFYDPNDTTRTLPVGSKVYEFELKQGAERIPGLRKIEEAYKAMLLDTEVPVNKSLFPLGA